MRSLAFLILVFYSHVLLAEQFGRWTELPNYTAKPEHKTILMAAVRWAANDIDHNERRYNFEYKIKKMHDYYRISVTIAKYNELMEPGYFSGGHFFLSVNEKGEVLSVSRGM